MARPPVKNPVAPRCEAIAKAAKALKEKKQKKPGPSIDADEYNAMYAAWCARQTVLYVSKVTGINQTTVKRYVEKGDPERGYPPIAERWKKVHASTIAVQDYDIIQARRDVQVTARRLLAKVALRIAAIDPIELDANQVAKQLQSVQQIIERTFGQADTTISIQQDRFAHWTVDDLMEYARTGIEPEKKVKGA